MSRIPLALTCLLLTALLLLSCTGDKTPPPPAMDVLTAMQAAMTDTAQTLPDGLTYSRAVDPSSPHYLTDTLFSALYGEAARGLLEADGGDGTAPPISDAALFLSIAPYPCELAVFRCSDTRSAATVAGLCRTRQDTLHRGWADTEWAAVTGRAAVAVEGSYVLLAVADDPETVLAGARRAIG